MPPQALMMDFPARIKHLPQWAGRPVPWFVAWIDGVPDFRIVDTNKLGPAIQENRCWVCGDKMGHYKSFVVGPMCALTRVVSEPPSHLACARFSAIVCPFMNTPARTRRDTALPEIRQEPGGYHIERNPGAVAVWTTKTYTPFRAQAGHPGLLFEMGDPESIDWFAEGRAATRAEVLRAIDSGLPELHPTLSEGCNPDEELAKMIRDIEPYFPKEDGPR